MNPGSLSMVTLGEPEVQFAIARSCVAVARPPSEVTSFASAVPALESGVLVGESEVMYIVAVAFLVGSATDVAVTLATVELGTVDGAAKTAEVAVQPVILPQEGLHVAPDWVRVQVTPLF